MPSSQLPQQMTLPQAQSAYDIMYPNQPGTGTATLPGAGTVPVTSSAAHDLMTMITTAVEEYGQSEAEKFAQTGDIAETAAYTSAAGIADSNARLALAAGNIEQAKIGLEVNKTIGSQRAEIAASGFGNAGTALSLGKASARQGVLDEQLAGVNANIQAGGYLEQEQAATAEAAATTAAGNQAGVLSATALTVANASKTNAITSAAAMGLNIPGLTGISSTSMPSVNPVTLQQINQQPGGGLKPIAAGNQTAQWAQAKAAQGGGVKYGFPMGVG